MERRRGHPAETQPLELEIEDLAFGGRGVAHVEGRVVLVEGGFPGDRVSARVYKRRPNLWEARALDVLRPSEDREPPRCRHTGICGGCKLQGLRYDRQLEAKSRQVREALIRLGGLQNPPVTEPVPAPEAFEYRNKMEFSFAVDRDRLICGLHHAGRFDRVFDLEECHLAPPAFGAIVRATRDLLRGRGIPAYDQRAHGGYARFLVVRRSVSSGEYLVNFVTTSEDYALREALVAKLREAVPEITGIVHTINDRRAQIALGDESEIWFGRAAMTERLSGLEFELGPSAFFQTNSVQAARLYDLVLDACGLTAEEHVLDLYCGTGTIALYLASGSRSVVGVESSAEAVDNARENAGRNRVTNARFECADVLEWLRSHAATWADPHEASVVVLDPPRAGLHPDVPDLLVATRPDRMVYVSCNPSALARDAAWLSQRGFVLCRVTPIDMFPHTAHIESVATFVRA